jgi:hypothetical protein
MRYQWMAFSTNNVRVWRNTRAKAELKALEREPARRPKRPATGKPA